MLKKLLSRVYDDTSQKPADSEDFIGNLEECEQCTNNLKFLFLPGIGLDSAVIPLKNKNLFLVQSVDFFYPLCDDGKLMGETLSFEIIQRYLIIKDFILLGKIAFANVVSDIYACGVVNIDEVKIILSVPDDLSEDEKQQVLKDVVSGFQESAQKINCKLSIDRISFNPWCIIGGVATSVSSRDEIIFPSNIQPGDVLILTKPLGVQLATNAQLWMEEDSENWKKLNEHLSREDVTEAYDKAVASMISLNDFAAKLMHKFKANGATDITGFGFIGHAENLLEYQKQKLDFVVTSLPVIRHVKKIAEVLNRQQKLYSGRMVETSGGLLIAVPSPNAQAFCDEFEATTQSACWIVGSVASGTGRVIIENLKIVEV